MDNLNTIGRGHVEKMQASLAFLKSNHAGSPNVMQAGAHLEASIWTAEADFDQDTLRVVRLHKEAVDAWVDYITSMNPTSAIFRFAMRASAAAYTAEAEVATNHRWND